MSPLINAVTAVALGAVPVPAQPVSVSGVGRIVLTPADADGHPVWFGVRGDRFWFRHLLPDGSLVARGWAAVTCLRVTGRVAEFTAVVPEGVGPIRNHAFVVKIIDGGRRPDQVAFVQASGGPERPPTRCFDLDAEFPGRPRHQVLAGGYVVRGS
ncbi:hypothetical protein [Actinoplanes sp. G11-F43]|uniref:hypothetical protein n=1 Tax=Actinoplanes sp. G11-F43 TaxID=3424130 RepID=UPI003D329BF5